MYISYLLSFLFIGFNDLEIYRKEYIVLKQIQS